jgi:hypothetical protein
VLRQNIDQVGSQQRGHPDRAVFNDKDQGDDQQVPAFPFKEEPQGLKRFFAPITMLQQFG